MYDRIVTTELSTAPKPFVFVLMPFDRTFDDIYTFGIKGAANDIGAYAERIDEQIFTEGILDRVFNQISRADVVIADMTARNANVFYEVGYAHALGKIVLLLTQHVDDIPFDLKHRQHTVYGGSIESLRSDLRPKLQWALAEASRRRLGTSTERFVLRVGGVTLSQDRPQTEKPLVAGKVPERDFPLSVQLRNVGAETLPEISHLYLFTHEDAALVPIEPPRGHDLMTIGTSYLRKDFTLLARQPRLEHFVGDESTDGLTKQYRLPVTIPSVPPGAIEEITLFFRLVDPVAEVAEQLRRMECRLRLHTARQYHDFGFELGIVLQVPGASEPKVHAPPN